MGYKEAQVLGRNILSFPDSFPPIDAIPTAAQYLMGCRSFDQYCCTARALLDPELFCPFCARELARRGRTPLEREGNWMLLENEFPHRNTARMRLVVPMHHVVSLKDLHPSDGGDILILLQRSGIENGGFLGRLGKPSHNVGTIEHFHINVTEPIPGKEFRPPLGKEFHELEEDYKRMLGFQNELIDKGRFQWLFSQEGIEETQPKAS